MNSGSPPVTMLMLPMSKIVEPRNRPKCITATSGSVNMRVCRNVYSISPPIRLGTFRSARGSTACTAAHTRACRATMSRKTANAPQKTGNTSG